MQLLRKQPDVCSTRTYYGCSSQSENQIGRTYLSKDDYTRTLNYRRWNNELKPFRSLKKRVASMFHKRNSFSDSSRGTSTQTITNNVTEQCKVEVMEKDGETDSDNNSVHSNWSELYYRQYIYNEYRG